MKVSDVMQKNVAYVTPEASLLNVARMIFGHGINGLPVCKGKKVIGFVTERDILAQFYPSVQEYVEDYAHARDFEAMEEKITELLTVTADKIMNKNVISVTADTPLLKAQSIMKVKSVGRLPVVDKNDHLLGIVSNGDIFRAVVGKRLPFAEDEEYHDWVAAHYDLVVDWDQRLKNEISDLKNIFRKKEIVDVLDVGCGTGEHDIALAKEEFKAVGLERSKLMISQSQKKWNNLPKSTKDNLSFIHGEYVDVLKEIREKFGAAIFMGNALAHNTKNYKKILQAVVSTLNPKNSIIVLQLVNSPKLIKINKGFQDFTVGKKEERESAYLDFYDAPREKTGDYTTNMAVFRFDGKRWRFGGMNSTPIAPLDQKKVYALLKSLGFTSISFYGSKALGESLFKEKFKPLEHDWMNVVATR